MVLPWSGIALADLIGAEPTSRAKVRGLRDSL
jgi:hypothetical protein